MAKKRLSAEIQRWHPVRIQNINGVRMVTLPARLLKWDRERLGEPFKWSAGNYVQIALTPEGRLVVEHIAEQELRGMATGEVLEDADKAVEITKRGPMPKPYRRQRRIRTWGDSGVESERWVSDHEDVLIPKSKLSWADEVRIWRTKRMDWGQEEAAQAVGVTQVTFSRWETGKHEPSDRRKLVYRDKMESYNRLRKEGKV